ncbi:MAG: sulfate adenylyltransferase subunit CysD [Bacteroidia bacterium]
MDTINYKLSHLDILEAESIYVIREVASQFESPVLLFSGGKDSIVLLHLCRKAFHPARLPFPLLHVDTGHNFDETIEFRDRLVKQIGANLIVAYVQDTINSGRVAEETGANASRNALQTTTLLDAIEKNGFDGAMGGARRDEEKARAKERFFSHRDEFGQWDPKNQRPELWSLFNGRKNFGEHFRIFPISNWTEMDIWQYIQRESLELPSIYFSHSRSCVKRNGVWLGVTDFLNINDDEVVEEKTVRFRTVGDATCTGAFESTASTLDEIIDEVSTLRLTERGGRADDKRSEASMEDRKKAGYF